MKSIRIDSRTHTLLKRCAAIEGKSMVQIVSEILSSTLKKYSFDTLEQWEQAREMQEITQVVQAFESDDGFNPQQIPFNTQILGLRRKLDDIDREIATSERPRPDLENLKYGIVEELNFAEKEALGQEQERYASLARKWEDVCREIVLPRNGE